MRSRDVNHSIDARPNTATPAAPRAVSSPGSHRVTSATASSTVLGRGVARLGSKVIDTRVSTSAPVAGVAATSWAITSWAAGGACGSLRRAT